MDPKCDYLLINTKGAQFTKLTEAMGKLVYGAIRKYVNRTGSRQVIEIESTENLEQHEREWVTEDQKHSSQVARVCYQKERSRDVALKGLICLKKLKDEEGVQVEKSLLSLMCDDNWTRNPAKFPTFWIAILSNMKLLVVAIVQMNVMNMRAILTSNFNRRTRNLN